MTLADRALAFAALAHAEVSQKRKYTGEPYITHPIAVMMIVESVGGTEEMKAVALLHDVIEDTNRTYDDIFVEFGRVVADMVHELTDRETGNRSERKAKARVRLSQASAEVQTIKLADLIHNTDTIVEQDPSFAKVYLGEKRELVNALSGGDPRLQALARDQIKEGLSMLAETGL